MNFNKKSNVVLNRYLAKPSLEQNNIIGLFEKYLFFLAWLVTMSKQKFFNKNPILAQSNTFCALDKLFNQDWNFNKLSNAFFCFGTWLNTPSNVHRVTDWAKDWNQKCSKLKSSAVCAMITKSIFPLFKISLTLDSTS